MATATIRALKPMRTRILLIALTGVVFLGYGLFTAQQARSATTLPKQVWGGIRQTGVLVHGKHITAVSRLGTGDYTVTFDRHVDNCSLQVTERLDGGFSDISNYDQFRIFGGSSTSQVEVVEVNAAGSSRHDGDFDIFGMCPSS